MKKSNKNSSETAKSKPAEDSKIAEAQAKPEEKKAKPVASAKEQSKPEEKKAKPETAKSKPAEDSKTAKAQPQSAKEPPKPAEAQATTAKAKAESSTQAEPIKLNGLYAFKLSMSSIYDEKGRFIPVTLLKFKPWRVTQIKNQKKEGYNSVQLACQPQKNKRSSKPIIGQSSSAGFQKGAALLKEIRQDKLENIKPGQELSIHSLQKGDIVKLSSVSKGHGFSGLVKRWNFKGGPASHGAKTHRTSGSIGNRTEPARVMPGKKMAGHYGVEQVTLNNVQVVDVVSKEQLILVKGPVPGARNSLVYLRKKTSAEERQKS